jgi:ribosomal protein L13
MGKKKVKSTTDAFQGELFGALEEPAPPVQPRKVTVTNHKVALPKYNWQPVQEAQRGTVMVVMSETVTISGVRQDDDCVYLAYNDPGTNKKTEQLYSHTDSIFVKL